MADSNTTTYSFTLPEVGASADSWGTKLNANWDKVDDLLDGSIAVNGITVTGGSIDGTPVGATTPSTGEFTSVTADGLTANINTGSFNSDTKIESVVGDVTFNYDTFGGSGNYAGSIDFYTKEATGSKRIRQRIKGNGDVSFYEDTGTTAKMVWDASAESLGIGGSPVTGASLYVSGGISRFKNTSSNWLDIDATSGSGNDVAIETRGNALILNSGAGFGTPTINFNTGDTERARIDSSGNLLVGTTNTAVGAGNTDTGVSIRGGSDNRSFFAVDSNYVASFSRNTTDGNIVEFKRNGSDAGAIKSISSGGGGISIDNEGSEFNLDMNGGSNSTSNTFFSRATLAPFTDNYYDVGRSANRYKDLYLSGGVKGTNLTFSGNNGTNEHARIDSSGNLLVGTTSIAALSGLAGVSVSAPTAGVAITSTSGVGQSWMNYVTTSAGDLAWYDATGAIGIRMYLAGSGSLYNSTGTYGTISDIKLKQDISDANSQWDDIKAVKFKNYKLKADVAKYGDDAVTMLGVVAQDLESSGMGGLIDETYLSEIDEDGNVVEAAEKTKTVKYSILYMKAVKALQEAMERIEQLEQRVDAMENK